MQSISASIEESVPEKAAGWQAIFWRPIIELSVSLPDEFPKQRNFSATFSGLNDRVGDIVKCFGGNGDDVRPNNFKRVRGLDYAQNRACFREGEILVLDSTGNLERTITFSEADRKLWCWGN